MKTKILLIWTSCLLVFVTARPAYSQSNGSGKRKVIRLDTLTIEGKIQKPQAFYILQRSNLNMDDLKQTESFIRKVEKSVEKEPF